jgi:hypothetical protein
LPQELSTLKNTHVVAGSKKSKSRPETQLAKAKQTKMHGDKIMVLDGIKPEQAIKQDFH